MAWEKDREDFIWFCKLSILMCSFFLKACEARALHAGRDAKEGVWSRNLYKKKEHYDTRREMVIQIQ